MKGIILAGGSGTRLYPITIGVSKQLLPIYDKPMIYYPLSTLMLAGIKDILIITTKEDQPGFMRLLSDGSQFGINISYAIQEKPNGLPQAFIIGEKFIGNDACALVLGDNIFFGNRFTEDLIKARENASLGITTIFGYKVKDPERFGVMELDNNNKVISVEEKPKQPKSNYAITGLYFYDNSVITKAKKLKPSARGEYEITDLNALYLKEKKLEAILFGRGHCWFDTGTFESLYDATTTIKVFENNQDTIICCPEQIAYDNNWIDKEKLLDIAKNLKKNTYGEFLKDVDSWSKRR